MTEFALGFDIGGLRLKVATVAREGFEVLDRAVHDMEPQHRDPRGVVERIREIAAASGVENACGVGLAVAGAVRRPENVVAKAANYPGWEDFDIAGDVSRAVGRPASVDNDANLFVYAESLAGAARGRKNVLGLTLGTGVGGGLVLDGSVHRGVHGLAGEVGHVVLYADGEPCGCGSRGCLEQYASTAFLLREGKRRAPDLIDSVPSAEVGKRLAEAARSGDEIARGLLEELGANLAAGVAGVINVVDVDAVLVGGGLAAAYDLFGSRFDAVLRDRTFASGSSLKILQAELGSDAGAIGAACMALS